MGTCLALTNQYLKAKKYFGHAQKLDEMNLRINQRLGKLHIRTNDLAGAAECYRRVLMQDA